MAGNKYPESHKMITFIEKAPFSDEQKSKWIEVLTSEGMTAETTEEVHQALIALPIEMFSSDWQRAKFNMDLAGILRQWRLAQGSKQFKHTR